ncbi:MAG: PKD domain-containing protein [Streptosporangiales bacterium]|nr:PKD domain-containing protein [Streptosporangiales bacterium]
MALAAVAALAGVVLLPGIAPAVHTPQDRIVSDDPANWTPNVQDGHVGALLQVGNKMIAGGNFTQVRPAGSTTTYNRNNILAFDATTGAIDTNFVPTVDGEVTSIVAAPDGNSVYIGGAFNNVNGVRSKSVGRINVNTGASVPGFSPPAMNGTVNKLLLKGGRLYVAGRFQSIGGADRPALATIDPATGDLDPFVDLGFSGIHNGGVTLVRSFDISPDGSRLVAVGNFRSVAGQTRRQIAMVDLTTGTASLANWSTTRYEPPCNTNFDTYMRDIDFSPDGEYFVVVTTGAYRAATLCDTATRWETAATGSGLQPSWVDYTGGDTLTQVAITGPVVYVGGHQRWQNNPFAGDRPGQGAVSRPGIAALDPDNGLPYSWNPTRARGEAVYEFLATPEGLWFGSDTNRVNDEYRWKVAFFPLDGGTVPPPDDPGALPGEIYLPGQGGSTNVAHRSYDGTTAGPTSDLGTGINWSAARGGVVIDGTLYTGWSDGRLYARSFDGSSFGAAREINTADQLVPMTTWHNQVPNITGMFFWKGRLFYTRAGQSTLYYRYFEPESGIVGAEEFTATGNLPDLSWTTVTGMFLSGDKLYVGNSTDGNLRRVDFVGGRPQAGTVQTVSGPNVDGSAWRSRAMFLYAGPPNQAPTATLSAQCQGLECTFDAAGSSDPDGSIASYRWDFGDGGTATGVTASHTYDEAGTYPVELTVTDNRGGTDTATDQLTVAPDNSPIGFVGVDSANGNARNLEVTVPTGVSPGDGLLLFLSHNSTGTPSEPSGVAGWTKVDTLVNGSLTTTVWQKAATAGDAGGAVTISFPDYIKSDLQLVAYAGTGSAPVDMFARAGDSSTATHTTPTVTTGAGGDWVLSYWADKSSSTTQWTPPSAQTVREATYGTGSGRITSLITDSDAGLPAGTYGGLTATTDAASGKATMWTIALRPG